MFVLLADRQITRRKRVHLVVDQKGEVQFSASKLGDVLAWLSEREERKLYIETDPPATFRIELTHVINPFKATKAEADEPALFGYGKDAGDPPCSDN